jgi:prepilin peptidase CpaA
LSLSEGISWAGLAFVFTVLVAATVWDLRRRRIPNPLVGTLAAGWVGFAVLGWAAGSDPQALSHLAAGGLLFGLALLAWYAKAVGGGDAKLFGALGLWLPLSVLPDFLIALGVVGGVQALASLATRLFRASEPEKDPERMPYAVSITLAAAWVLLRT